MYETRPLEELLAIYAQRKNLSISTVGKYAIGAHDLHTRLPEGRITIARIKRLVQYLSNNWPSDTEWRPDVPRPAPLSGSPAAKEAA